MSGGKILINDLVKLITEYTGYDKHIIYESERPAGVGRHIASIFLAEELIDFSLKVSLKQGLKTTVEMEWYKTFYSK